MPRLGKTGRRGLIALAIFVAVLAIAAAVILRSFDAEHMRGILSSRLTTALGRNVTLGNLRLGLFPPSLYVRDAQIAEAFGFSDPVFSTAKTFEMRVRLMPLLHGRVEVPSVQLDQPVIHLVKNAEGKWNFASLGESKPGAQTGQAPAGETERVLQVEEFQLRDGTVTVDDLQKKTPRVTLDHISLEVTNFAPGRPFDWNLSVHPPGPGSSLVRASGRGGPLGKQNLAASPVDGHIVFQDVALESLSSFTEQPGLAGIFNGEADFKSNGSSAEAKGTYKVEKLRLSTAGGRAQAPVSGRFEVSMPENASQVLVRQFEMVCGKAIAQTTGRLGFEPRPETELRVHVNNAPLADIARLFPMFNVKLPAGSSFTEGTLTAALRAFGPSSALKESGTLDVHSARLAGYSIAGQLGSVVKLAGVETGGRDTAIDRLHTAFESDPAYTRLSDMILVIPGMEVTGEGGFNPAGALNFGGAATLTRASAVSGLLTQAIGRGAAGANKVPFRVSGTMDHPVFTPDVGKMVNEEVGRQIQKQLGKPGSPQTDQLMKGLQGLFNKKK